MTTTADGWTDFHGIRDGNLVAVSLRQCATYPQLGKRFTLGDGEGNWCVGQVESVDLTIAYVRLDLTTWRSAG